jgi:hypothetical protein
MSRSSAARRRKTMEISREEMDARLERLVSILTKSPRALIEEIKAKYPHPRAALSEHALAEDGSYPTITMDDYCVGGALCRALMADTPRYESSFHFPSSVTIARVLQEVNMTLDAVTGDRYACRIIESNDAGHFEDAWRQAEEALSYGRTTG